MADLLVRRHTAQDANVYALFFRAVDAKVWDVANNAWATFVDANIDNYDVVGTELGTYSRIYKYAMPTHANFGVGRFTALLFQRVGGAPAVGDTMADTNNSNSVGDGQSQIDFTFDGTSVCNDLVYHARLELNIDDANSQDEYTVVWYRNGVAIGPDATTTPQIQLIKRADGTDLLAATNLSQVGSTLAWKKDATTTARTSKGEAVIVKLTSTIDGTVRTWYEERSRDN